MNWIILVLVAWLVFGWVGVVLVLILPALRLAVVLKEYVHCAIDKERGRVRIFVGRR